MRPQNLARVLTVCGFGVGAMWPSTALSCLRSSQPSHTIDQNLIGVDQQAPAGIDSLSVEVGPAAKRPVDDGGCGEEYAISCGGTVARVSVVPGFDEHTAPARIGYAIELIQGRLPEGLSLPVEGPVLPLEDKASGELTLVFYWDGSEGQGRQSVDFTLELFPVDAAGNVGESQTVRILDRVDDASCAAVHPRRSPEPTLWLLLLGLWLWGAKSEPRIFS